MIVTEKKPHKSATWMFVHLYTAMEPNSKPASAPSQDTSASAADAGTESNEDREMEEEMAMWNQRLTTLRDKENFKDKVDPHARVISN